MAELLAADDLGAKRAYRPWEQRGRLLILRKRIGSRPKRFCPWQNEIRSGSFRNEGNEGPLIRVDRQIKGRAN